MSMDHPLGPNVPVEYAFIWMTLHNDQIQINVNCNTVQELHPSHSVTFSVDDGNDN